MRVMLVPVEGDVGCRHTVRAWRCCRLFLPVKKIRNDNVQTIASLLQCSALADVYTLFTIYTVVLNTWDTLDSTPLHDSTPGDNIVKGQSIVRGVSIMCVIRYFVLYTIVECCTITCTWYFPFYPLPIEEEAQQPDVYGATGVSASFSVEE